MSYSGWVQDFQFGRAPVTEGWVASADPVIRDLDLLLPDGDHLAVVGPSGVGKSTLAGVIAGLLDPQSGRVLLGGRELEAIDAIGARELVERLGGRHADVDPAALSAGERQLVTLVRAYLTCPAGDSGRSHLPPGSTGRERSLSWTATGRCWVLIRSC